MLVNDSDFCESDDDLETLKDITMDEELLHSEIGSSSRRGSVQGRTVINRDHIQGHERLFLDYFVEPPVYPPNLFQRRFRMKHSLFLRIQAGVEAHNPYFFKKGNCVGKLGLSSLQKITATLRMLAYGVVADFVDEYVRIGECTAIESLKYFVKAMVDIFSNEYLRSPNCNDIAKLLAVVESCGFPRMLGSIDCMHWKWKNCSSALKGMYIGHIHKPTIILEAVASYDLWIWHAFFGSPGSHNDINVLERSFVFTELVQGRASLVNYTVNGNEYTMGYYLANGIYPQRSAFVKTIPFPQGNKKKLFAATQEATRKDVECAFGVLQARFAIVRRPTRFWNTKMLNML